MSRLEIYRTALLAADPALSAEHLRTTLGLQGPDFADFVIDHGLGPLWHKRTGCDEFADSRRAAEALFLAQEHALWEAHQLFEERGIEYVLVKGAANRLHLYANPATRACHDIDLLVHPDDRFRAAQALLEIGYELMPKVENIGHEVALVRGIVTFDLHWRLLREGRLSKDPVQAILARRRSVFGLRLPHADDSLFVALVHPAFAKHLAGYETGLHRVVDVLRLLESEDYSPDQVIEILRSSGVQSAAWATLQWSELLAGPSAPESIAYLAKQLRPGRIRRAWLDYWLRNEFSERTAGQHKLRLLAFSSLLHDSPKGVLQAIRGRRNARRCEEQEMQAFGKLVP